MCLHMAVLVSRWEQPIQAKTCPLDWGCLRRGSCSQEVCKAQLCCFQISAGGSTMNGVANTIAAVLLVVCALLWLRAMYHQWTFTSNVKDINI